MVMLSSAEQSENAVEPSVRRLFGRVICLSDVHPEKAELSIDDISCAKVTNESDVQPENIAVLIGAEEFIVALCSAVQPENALEQICVTLAGIVISESDEQLLKQLEDSCCKLLGKLICCRLVQLENAQEPIDDRVLGN